ALVELGFRAVTMPEKRDLGVFVFLCADKLISNAIIQRFSAHRNKLRVRVSQDRLPLSWVMIANQEIVMELEHAQLRIAIHEEGKDEISVPDSLTFAHFNFIVVAVKFLDRFPVRVIFT